MSEERMAEVAGVDGTGWDVVVVGGGAAGLSAALTLARVRRSVLVVDSGEPRNAPAERTGVHGLLGREGVSPLELLRTGRAEVASYGGRVVAGRVTRIVRDGDGFDVRAEGARVRARRLLVATGLVDELPDVPGLAERWGRDVHHCVYCHGWEVRDTAIGVLGAFHQALMFRQVSDDVTLFRDPGTELSDAQWEQLAGLGVAVVDGPVAGLRIDGEDRLSGVRLASGPVVPVRHLAVMPYLAARASFLDGLGLALRDHPMGVGRQLAVDAAGFTGVPGIWAAGNVSDLVANVAAAAAAGVAAAAAITMDLVTAGAERAAAGRARPRTAADDAVFGPASEAEVARRVLGTAAHGLHLPPPAAAPDA
ncbi:MULTISPECIES: NAD(P)/FAD-dependent oxidoreductase [Streptomycetaceae]|uniref:NAD(P)/FAD-dependent oxidoreductase n=1 Tax=Streptomycetaceae TaxID=2062 RepID=UPI00300A77B4